MLGQTTSNICDLYNFRGMGMNLFVEIKEENQSSAVFISTVLSNKWITPTFAITYPL